MSAADVERLVAQDHHDPHSLLGAHETKGGVTIRTLHPAAARVVVQPAGVELQRVHPGGLFEVQLRGEKLLAIFELEKSIYELRYELNNRPDWVPIPVAGIARLLEEEVTPS